MLGKEFTRTLRAAQAGDAAAFTRLWRDANPVLVRYLRVVGHDDPYDGACEGWVTAVRGLPAFDGVESDWRVWLLGCARVRGQEGTLRRAWGSAVASLSRGVDPIEVDDLYPPGTDDPTQRGISDAIAAMRNLPLGQGEVLFLRLGAGLSVDETRQVVGGDETSVRRLEERALERLDVSAELLAWSLAAPSTTAELADEHVALGRFRSLPGAGRRSRSRGAGGGGAAGPAVRSRPESQNGSSGTRTVSMSVSGTRRVAGSTVVKQSRAAAVTIAAISASLTSLSGLTAAAYAGVLPDPVQRVMHRAVGAPEPGATDGPGTPERGGTTPTGPGSPKRPGASPTKNSTAGPNPSSTKSAAATKTPTHKTSTPNTPTHTTPTHATPTHKTQSVNPSSTKSPAATKTKSSTGRSSDGRTGSDTTGSDATGTDGTSADATTSTSTPRGANPKPGNGSADR
jgi:DNA-directed RNA polymerase specialized sigma24 family protein